MHGDAFHYSKSTTPVTGIGPITLGPDTTMTGTESSVTYPQFLKLPGGDLLFIFREGASGNGDTYINRYSISTLTWTNVHGSTSTQNPFIKGTGWTPNYNAYLNMPQLGGPNHDELVLTWCWRTSSGLSDAGTGFSGYQTNNNLNFARSSDAGLTWHRFGGTSYALPITRDLEIAAANKADILVTIPEGSSLINQASTCLDHNDNPVTCTWWAPNTPTNNYRRQYMVVFRDDNGTPLTTDDTWQTRTVSNRANDPIGTRYAEDHVRDLGRPIVVNDDDDRIIVAYRDNQSTSSLTTGVANGLTLVHSLPKADDPHRLLWIQFDLTSDNLGNYEPIIDNELWDRDRQLHFLYQPAEGQGYTAPANLASRFSVLEWDAAAYFAHSPQPSLAFSPDRTQITITCPSQPSWAYRLWSSTDLVNWTEIETRAGTGQPLAFTQAANVGEARRFWRIEFKEGGF
jgi:BNR repeat-containing family member